jgi:hypothetical protein
MLRLVHPAPQGQHPPARKKGDRSPALSLSVEETRHLRAAVSALARNMGGFAVAAVVVGVSIQTLHAVMNPKRRPHPGIALRVARASGMSVEAVLGGCLSPMGRCPTCGSRVGDKPALRTAGGAR